jgi:hypothetical protein
MSSTEQARLGLGRLVVGIVQNHELDRASSAGAWSHGNTEVISGLFLSGGGLNRLDD